MREIQFKVWTGSLMLDSGFSINPNGYIYDIHHKCQENWIKRQFTGLIDRGGVKIYEGDILEVCDYYMEPTIHKVEWGGNDYPAFTLTPELGAECNCFSHIAANGDILIKVIGNIHQYPELLS